MNNLGADRTGEVGGAQAPVRELLAQLEAAGLTVTLTAEGPRLRGKRVPAELAAAAKARREELVRELEERQARDRDRFNRVPAEGVLEWPERELMLGGRQGERFGSRPEVRLVMGYVLRQGQVVHDWVMRRTQGYWERGWGKTESWLDMDVTAAVELACWQLRRPLGQVIEFLEASEASRELVLTWQAPGGNTNKQ